MADNKKVKVAILGGGWFGSYHLENLLKMDDVEVIALCSASEKSVGRLAEKAPLARRYLKYADMLEAEADLQAIIVCVPPHQHNNVEIEAAKRNIHLYIEKPLGISLAEVHAYQSAIAKSTSICSIGYQALYNPCLDEIKAFLADKKVGSVTAKWIGSMPQTPWWRVKNQSGGQFHEQATHILNMLIYLFGDISSVFTKSHTGLMSHIENYDVEDATASICTLENGLLATVSCGCFVDEALGKSEVSFEIYTNKGVVKYAWGNSMSFERKNHSKTTTFETSFHYEAVESFITAVATGDSSKIKCTYADAVRTFNATMASNLSLKENKEVFLRDLKRPS